MSRQSLQFCVRNEPHGHLTGVLQFAVFLDTIRGVETDTSTGEDVADQRL